MIPETDSAQPSGTRRRSKTRRNVLFAFLGLFLVAAIIGTVFVANLARSFDSKTEHIANAFPDEASRPAKSASDAMNILMLGSDSRGDSLDMAGAGEASDQRSDTMMWVHIPADRKNIVMMSIMRDTWVDIPGVGEAKINAAMAYGGVPLVVQTLEGLFKQRLDHVAIVNFDGFKAITDSLGGVQVDVPLSFTTADDKFTFEAGPQVIDGDQALAFVRERYAFTDGDYQRVRNQQLFLKAVMNTALTPANLTNPVKINELVNKVAPSLTVDSELNSGAMGALALSLRDVRGSDVKAFTLPTLGTGTSADGQSIVLPDDAAIAAISEALSNDSLVAYMRGSGLG
ncbi:LCP family protein [Arthrobacter antibioticus]|uniref:LCP family protein n=1 Tax=Arthrobacter sp. H35-MC1 TaxID=3046203 RepID=UPI0024BA510D|nr:LCP family protein [Arthrobacter sp. H35-MC1]MDJ0316246.1 LCP family protein [Arthrobacter sp. H35-MC1]